MWRALGVFLGFQLLSGLCSGVTVTQKENIIAIQNGSKAIIPCEHDDISYYTVLWYQQKEVDRQLQLVATSLGVNSAEMEDEFKPRYTVVRPTVLNTSLSINPGMVEDTAVYFCVASKGQGDIVYFGEGTKLTVLEDGLNITSPKVVIFPPSKQEIKEKGKATLVCLASDFYPDHIKLFWKVNDAEREDGVRTDDFSRWDKVSKSYSLTSRLRISVQEWFNSKNSFQCAVKFHLDKIQYQVIRGEAGCSITEESYMRYGNSTKLTYLVLLWKAMLYALLVSALVWRVKAGDKLSRE